MILCVLQCLRSLLNTSAPVSLSSCNFCKNKFLQMKIFQQKSVLKSKTTIFLIKMNKMKKILALCLCVYVSLSHLNFSRSASLHEKVKLHEGKVMEVSEEGRIMLNSKRYILYTPFCAEAILTWK